MSDELERLLRDAPRVFPGPHPHAVRSAEEQARKHLPRQSRRRVRGIAALAVALLGAIASGVAVGWWAATASATDAATLGTPSVGVGLLPVRGWTVVQTGTEATLARPSRAIAANTRLHPDDEPGELPYKTLTRLSPRGAVIVATFTVRGDRFHDSWFPKRRLPLQLADADPEIDGSAEIRPSKPLGQYQIRAAVGEYNVNVDAYFGAAVPSLAALAEAQRQLDRLVVNPVRGDARGRMPVARSTPAAASRIVDRTIVCTPARTYSGSRTFDLFATPQQPPAPGATEPYPAFAEITTNLPGRHRDLLVVNSRLRPDALPGVGPRVAGVFLNTTRCWPSRAQLSLTRRGLPGPPIAWRKEADCELRGRIVVRVRATLDAPEIWRRLDPAFVGAQRRVASAAVAVRDARTRKPVAFLRLERGSIRLWLSPRCN